jgi:hypothetical protein
MLKLNPNDMLLYDVERLKTKENRTMQFRVKIGTSLPNIRLPMFNLDNYLISRKYIRDITDENDYGDVLFDAEEKGKIYVNNIFVCTNEGMCFGYNFFNIRIPRERNHLEYGRVVGAVARLWDNETDMNKHTLYETLKSKKCVEAHAIEYMRNETKQFFIQHIIKQTGVDKLIKLEMEKSFKKHFNLKYHIVSDVWADLVNQNGLDQFIKTEEEKLLFCLDSVVASKDLLPDFDIFKEAKFKIETCRSLTSPIKYAWDETKRLLRINAHVFESVEDAIKFVAFEVLSDIDPEFYKNHLKLATRILPQHELDLIHNQHKSSVNALPLANAPKKIKNQRPQAPPGYEWLNLGWVIKATGDDDYIPPSLHHTEDEEDIVKKRKIN